MAAHSEAYREIAVPVSIFASLRHSLAKEAGELPAIHALHDAGYSSGVAAAEAMRGAPDEDLLRLSEDDFWSRLAAFFAKRGWGTLSHAALHEAVGSLTSADWVEAAGEDGGEDASCSFSTGFLAGLLSTLAGGPVAVLEVQCRARGDETCTFAYGNATAIHEVYGQLLDGATLPQAVDAL